ncbi:disease resistance-responsive (dirigent-likeprotein) family protein [Striga asiatica]|uniref:Dirigent protein n=1 Tax=Striga asiatica TaxID=4170 RepID=A0A5A7R0E9_STRAF|nr:disease resistance-responsive (dirigent-likeprotein) family protein [Striga asiatica]
MKFKPLAMTNPSFSTILILLLLSITLALSWPDPSLDRHFKLLANSRNSTLTKLQIYIHADFLVHSKTQTVFEVASCDITAESPGFYGRVYVIDNPLTVTADPGSEYLGRYQGTNVYSDFREPAANMNMAMTFEGGIYEGSTISIFGRQPVNEEVRVLSVVGGTGIFRLAKGVVLARTVSLDSITKVGHYVYVIYVLTPAAAAGGDVAAAA